MDKDVQEITEMATQYIAETQPLLDKQAAASEAFSDKLAGTASKLVARGLLHQDKLDDFIEKSAEDHTFVLNYLNRLAESVGPDQLGAPTHTTKHAENADPFVAEFAPEFLEEDGLDD